jgi:secondary thiamine-phosphate synthase enzyme
MGWFMSLRQAMMRFAVETTGQGFYDITDDIRSFVAKERISTGLITVFLHHTSASLIIQENADPTVQEDLLAFFKRLSPEDGQSYRHGYEGPDDMPAHIRTALTAVQVAITVSDGQLNLGTWQGVYLVEHRYRPHRRQLTLHLLGE